MRFHNEELFVFVRCQVIRSILKDVMFFVHLDISGSYPRHGGWSLFPCPDALEDGEGCIFFDVHVVLFEAIQKLQDPWIGLRENLQETPMIFMIHGKIKGFPLRCSLKAKPMDGLPDLLI